MRCKVQSEQFSAESSSTGMKFSIEISSHKNKPEVTENSQFECRHESKFIVLFQIFRPIRIPLQGPASTVFHGNSLPLIESFQLRP